MSSKPASRCATRLAGRCVSGSSSTRPRQAREPSPAVAGPVAATPNPAGLAALRRTLEIPAGGALPIQVPVRVPTGVARIDWQLAASEEGGTAGDRLALKQSVAPAVPRTVRQASLTRLGDTLEVPLGHDPDALPGRSAVRLVLASSIAGSLNGVRDWFLRYPYTCLEQRASRGGRARRSRSVGGGACGTARLSRPGWPGIVLSGARGGSSSGSDTLTAYLLSLAEAAALPLPREARERMLEGLAAFAEGRIRRDGWSPRPDLTARRLAALAVLARHERAGVAMVTALEIAPERLPDAAIAATGSPCCSVCPRCRSSGCGSSTRGRCCAGGSWRAARGWSSQATPASRCGG